MMDSKETSVKTAFETDFDRNREVTDSINSSHSYNGQSNDNHIKEVVEASSHEENKFEEDLSDSCDELILPTHDNSTAGADDNLTSQPCISHAGDNSTSQSSIASDDANSTSQPSNFSADDNTTSQPCTSSADDNTTSQPCISSADDNSTGNGRHFEKSETRCNGGTEIKGEIHSHQPSSNPTIVLHHTLGFPMNGRQRSNSCDHNSDDGLSLSPSTERNGAHILPTQRHRDSSPKTAELNRFSSPKRIRKKKADDDFDYHDPEEIDFGQKKKKRKRMKEEKSDNKRKNGDKEDGVKKSSHKKRVYYEKTAVTVSSGKTSPGEEAKTGTRRMSEVGEAFIQPNTSPSITNLMTNGHLDEKPNPSSNGEFETEQKKTLSSSYVRLKPIKIPQTVLKNVMREHGPNIGLGLSPVNQNSIQTSSEAKKRGRKKKTDDNISNNSQGHKRTGKKLVNNHRSDEERKGNDKADSVHHTVINEDSNGNKDSKTALQVPSQSELQPKRKRLSDFCDELTQQPKKKRRKNSKERDSVSHVNLANIPPGKIKVETSPNANQEPDAPPKKKRGRKKKTDTVVHDSETHQNTASKTERKKKPNNQQNNAEGEVNKHSATAIEQSLDKKDSSLQGKEAVPSVSNESITGEQKSEIVEKANTPKKFRPKKNSHSSASRTKKCGTCEGCRRDACGQCFSCDINAKFKDKLKIGMAECLNRKCLNPILWSKSSLKNRGPLPKNGITMTLLMQEQDDGVSPFKEIDGIVYDFRCIWCKKLPRPGSSNRSELYRHYSKYHFADELEAEFGHLKACPTCRCSLTKKSAIDHMGQVHDKVDKYLPPEARIPSRLKTGRGKKKLVSGTNAADEFPFPDIPEKYIPFNNEIVRTTQIKLVEVDLSDGEDNGLQSRIPGHNIGNERKPVMDASRTEKSDDEKEDEASRQDGVCRICGEHVSYSDIGGHFETHGFVVEQAVSKHGEFVRQIRDQGYLTLTASATASKTDLKLEEKPDLQA